MKTLLKAVSVIGTAVVLAGCSSNAPQPVPTVTATATVTVTPEVTEPARLSDEEFGNLVKNEYPQLVNIEDAKFVQLAETICTGFDSGLSTGEILVLLTKNDSGNVTFVEAMGYLIGVGTINYCPEHLSKIKTDLSMYETN